MVSSAVDHMVAITVFLAAILLFIGLFSQTVSTAIIYQQHKALATKTSDLLDNMLLNPGIPINWGQTDDSPAGFGLQDPEFTQYKISPFSLMRLANTGSTPVYYSRMGSYYNNITMGSKNFLLVSNNSIISYSTALRLLGINNTYGFQLMMDPIVTVTASEKNPSNPLRISIEAHGTGFPLAEADVTYCLITVLLNGDPNGSPAYTTRYGTAHTDRQGAVTLEFNEVNNNALSYSFIAYAHLSGLVGVGYSERASSPDQYVIPFVEDISEGRVLIGHSYDIQHFSPPAAELKYNASFVFLSEDFTFREMPLEHSVGFVNYSDPDSDPSIYGVLNIPTNNPGILMITYQLGDSPQEGGIVMMPWGVSALSFPVTFGGDPASQDWVATDMRQVTVGGVAYQAKLALWSLEGYQVNG
jgi:hypothetical protein